MKRTWWACLLIVVIVSCSKKVSELPPVTQTGANTFGAVVNGELWVPKSFGPINANDKLEARFTGPASVRIVAKNFASSPTETEFEIFLANITAPGTFLLNTTVVHPSTSASYGYYVKRRVTPENEWITSASSTGSVTITRYDVANRIISGTFQFNALNSYNAPSPLTVTDGRFDLEIQ